MKKNKDREKLVAQIKDIRQRISQPLTHKEIQEIKKELSVIEEKLGIKN